MGARIVAVILAAAAGAASAETRHTVVPKDTLWDLAQHYYHDPFQWRRIADANPPPDVKDPHWIYPGQVILIPDEGPAAPAVAETPEPDSPALQPAVYRPEPAPAPALAHDALSARMPEGLVAAANSRLKAPPKWRGNGRVTGFDGREVMAAQGDPIDLALDAEAKTGDRFIVYRKAAPSEDDTDKRATYLEKVGSVEVRKELGGRRYRAVILTSSDSIQVDDVVARGQ